MKRANGTGAVIKHSGNRRRPYEARITAGYSDTGKLISRAVGWYATRDEAMSALIAYNNSPYDIDARQVTFAALFERWYARAVEQGRLSPQTISLIKSAYNRHCAALADKPYTSLRAYNMQACIDSSGGSGGNVKNLFYSLDRYAMELDIINKCYSDLTHVASRAPAHKTVFSDAVVSRLLDNVTAPDVDTVLILLYSGWRISELLGLRKENVHIDATGKTINTMRGGVKTRAGKDRIVPVHSAILPLVKLRYGRADNYLIEDESGKPYAVERYRAVWARIMGIIGARHTPHETRHTFRSWLDAASAPLSCVNRIMGHTCADVGLQVYTHTTIEQLAAAVELIPAKK